MDSNNQMLAPSQIQGVESVYVAMGQRTINSSSLDLRVPMFRLILRNTKGISREGKPHELIIYSATDRKVMIGPVQSLYEGHIFRFLVSSLVSSSVMNREG